MYDTNQTQHQLDDLYARHDRERGGALVVVGYILAIVIPIVGFILGIVTITRPERAQSKHGIWIVVLSVIAFAAYVVIFMAVAAHAAAHAQCVSDAYQPSMLSAC